MAEADVNVLAALDLERDKFLQDLRSAQQDIEAFIAKVESLQANLNVNLRFDVARASLESFIREFEARGINLPINVGGGGGAVGAGITNIFNSFSSSSVSATQQNLSTQFSQSLSQFFQSNQFGGGGGSGGSGGGSGGYSSGRLYGLSRFFTGYMATRELMRIGEAARQYGIDSVEATGDSLAQYKAEEGFIGKFPWANLILDPSGGQELSRQSIVEDAQFQDETTQGIRNLRLQTFQLGSEASASGVAGVERTRIESESRYKVATADIDKKRAAALEPIAKERARRLQAVEADFSARKDALFDAAGGGGFSSVTNAQLANLNAQHDAAISGVYSEFAGYMKPIEDSFKQQRDAETRLRDNAIRDAQADQTYRNAVSGMAVAGINESLSIARLGISGQSQEAERQGFAFGLQQKQAELEAKAQQAETVGNAAEAFNLRRQARILAGAAPELIGINDTSITARETLANAQNQTAIGSVGASASEALLRSTGNISESERQAIEREASDRVKNLRDEAEALKTVNQAESQRKTALADAEEDAKNVRLRAFDQAQALRSQDNTAAIGDTTAALNLRSRGLTFQAEEQSADAQYNRRIEQLRRDPNRRAEADALEQERDAARAARGFGRTENAHRIQASADTLGLVNQHRDAEAELSQIEEQYREQLVNAGGDPQATAAINALHQQRLQHFAQTNITGASTTNMRSIYFGLQAAAAGDPTGARARSAVNARNAALAELHGATRGGPVLMDAPWNAGLHGIGEAMHKGGRNPGTEPYMTDPFSPHGHGGASGDVGSIEKSAKTIEDAARMFQAAVQDLVSV